MVARNPTLRAMRLSSAAIATARRVNVNLARFIGTPVAAKVGGGLRSGVHAVEPCEHHEAGSLSDGQNSPPPRQQTIEEPSDEDLRRLAPSLRTIELTPKLIIQAIHEPIHHVVFPNGGVVSLTTAIADGSIVEVATIGAEGLVGINAFYGGATADAESMVQVHGATASVLP